MENETLWKDPVFEKWWPLGQSMMIARAPIRRVAYALEAEGIRLNQACGHMWESDWVSRSSIDDLFSSTGKVSVCWSMMFALPTTGEWTVIWNNSGLCTGHDSLAHCLTRFQRLETLHFYSTDRNSTQLAGTHFAHRRPGKSGELIERNVYCCNQGSRWHFQQHGVPLPEEDVERYAAKRKRDRLNEEVMMGLLKRLGVKPWCENTYDFRNACFRVTDVMPVPTRRAVSFEEIRARASGEEPLVAEDRELHGPPDYLRGKCRFPAQAGPAALLKNGTWCGHGEATFWLYDIRTTNDELFTVQLPELNSVPVVEVTPRSGGAAFAIYDGRRHPANAFCGSEMKPIQQSSEVCPRCGSAIFRLAVGFEVPAEAQSGNDTSWFALAVECEHCGHSRIAYEDETA